MKIKNVRILCFILNFIFNSYLLCGLKDGTSILTVDGLDSIGSIDVGRKVIGYDLDKKSFTVVEVQGKTSYFSSGLIIRTDKKIIHATGDQLFYEKSRGDFIKAEELVIGSELVDKDGQFYSCLNITPDNTQVKYYDITLDEPHLFFSTTSCILTHNMVAAQPALAVAGWGVGTIIACAYLKNAPQVFTKLDEAQSHVEKNMQAFVFSMRNPQFAPRSTPAKPNQQKINIDSKIYNQMLNSSLSNPMCISALMKDDGNVECILYSYGVTQFSKQFSCAWKEFSRETVSRDHPLVKVFVEEQCKADLEELAEIVKGWPADLIAELKAANLSTIPTQRPKIVQRCFEPTIRNITFNAQAVYNMLAKQIPTSTISHVIKCGNPNPAKRPHLLIYSNQKYNVAVLVDKSSNKVINVGHYDDVKELDKPKVKTNIDELDDNKIEHIKNGSKGKDHKWEKLVPDKDWEKIKKIIIDVMETGVSVPYKRKGKIKSKEVTNKTVEVTYVEIDGDIKISNAWVKSDGK